MNITSLKSPATDVFVGLAISRVLPPLSPPAPKLSSDPRAKRNPKRKREHDLGRAAVYSALLNFGFSSPPLVLSGERRMPIWPDGVVGSITHAAGSAVCLVGSSKNYLSIGVDLEPVRKLRPGLAKRVCTKQEQDWCAAGSEAECQYRTLLIFSAKESIFKAIYPLVRCHFGFHAAECIWNEDEQCLTGRLTKSLSANIREGFSFRVGVQNCSEAVFTSVVLER